MEKILSLGTIDKGLQVIATEEAVNVRVFLNWPSTRGNNEPGYGAELFHTLNPTEVAKLRDFLDEWLMEIT
jgi:hypothetical protein